MKSLIFRLGSLAITGIIHFVAVASIFRVWQPIADWYLKQILARGTDLYNSVSYVAYLLNHFTLRVDGWKYTWFSGVPFSLDYPSLYFYIMMPFSSYFGLVKGVQIFAIAASLAFIGCCYLLFATLSRNRILAVILAIATAYSVNIYRALVYAGGIPVFATQAFFPLVLYLIVKFIQTNNRNFLLIAGLLSGLGFLGHPQHFVNFIFPSVAILLLLPYYNNTFFTLKKIKYVFLYLGVSFLIGLPQFYSLFYSGAIKKITDLSSSVDPKKVEWARNQFYVAFSGTNNVLFHLLAIAMLFFIIGLILSKSRLRLFIDSISFGLVAGWVVFYIYLLSIGIDVYHGGWEAWYKLFWPMPVVIGVVISQLWKVFLDGITERVSFVKVKFFVPLIIEFISGSILIVFGLLLFSYYTKNTISKIDMDISVFTSTVPEALAARLTNTGLEKVKKEIKPSFLNDSYGNYRLYSNDQTFNIWWNSLFKTPLARGYIDPPIDRWGIFWTDAALSKAKGGDTSLETDWHTPKKIVEQNINFLLDWFAIAYLKDKYTREKEDTIGVLADLLTSDKFIEQKEERVISGGIYRSAIPGKSYWLEAPERTEAIPFYKIKSNLVSPIHQATNAPSILVIGGREGFEIIVRFLAMMGLNSQKAIIVYGPSYIDNISLSQMRDFDAIILYKYDYKNYSKSWDRIAKYLEKGGRVFIDTGAEVKESFNKTLPDIFPIIQTKRDNLGRLWEAEVKDLSIIENIKINAFSDFTFENKPWNISYPPNKEADIKEGKVLMSSHGYPVLVEKEIGEGRLIWSGLNLPYHVLYKYNMEEGKLLVNLLNRLFHFGGKAPWYNVNWVSPSERIISSKKAKGVLIKEQAFDGWSAKVEGVNKSSTLTIYKAGPTTPGFMYVRIPQDMQNEFSVRFLYKGSFLSWASTVISLATILLLLDFILLKGRIIKSIVYPVWSKIFKKTKSQWDKEDY